MIWINTFLTRLIIVWHLFLAVIVFVTDYYRLRCCTYTINWADFGSFILFRLFLPSFWNWLLNYQRLSLCVYLNGDGLKEENLCLINAADQFVKLEPVSFLHCFDFLLTVFVRCSRCWWDLHWKLGSPGVSPYLFSKTDQTSFASREGLKHFLESLQGMQSNASIRFILEVTFIERWILF